MPRSFAGQVPIVVAAVLAWLAFAAPSAAQWVQTTPRNPAVSPLNPLTPAQRNQLILRGRNDELQAIGRMQQGLQYQQNQQIYRELDRTRPQPQMDTRVPSIKPSCMKKIFGNKYVQTKCQ
jgi:parvulin-like peptidyl-prolyl isomerase